MSQQSFQSSWMTEELSLLRDSVRRFFEAEAIPNDRRWMAQKHVDRSFWLKAGELGSGRGSKKATSASMFAGIIRSFGSSSVAVSSPAQSVYDPPEFFKLNFVCPCSRMFFDENHR